MTLDGLNLDNAPNTFGSYVTLNGDENTIAMGAGGKALYASGRKENSGNVRGDSNTISSGDGGIGYLKATGDIAAEDSGAIDLTLRDYLNVNGSISAESGGVVKFTNNGSADIDGRWRQQRVQPCIFDRAKDHRSYRRNGDDVYQRALREWE